MNPIYPLFLFCFILTLVATVLFERSALPKLRQKAKQPIYAEGPSWHEKKSGTPTMGGLAFLFAICLSLLLSLPILLDEYASTHALSLVLSLLYAVENAAIGVADDLTKLRHRENAGLTPTQKLIFQFLFAGMFLFLRARLLGAQTAFVFSFGTWELGWLYYPVSLLLLVGTVNFANLTDGIDGLASSVAFSIGVALFYLSFGLSPETAILACALMGGAIGFLCFNLHPAKIFMGDTGSLFFGAIAASAVFMLENPLLILPVGAVYMLEGLSVILQVMVYKLTKKRLFRMAPLHHHFEKCGYSENRICILALLFTLLSSLIAFTVYLS